MYDESVELRQFRGDEIGQTVCFDIYKSHLYAVSAQTEPATDEVNCTSFYLWVCVAPTNNTQDVGHPAESGAEISRKAPLMILHRISPCSAMRLRTS